MPTGTDDDNRYVAVANTPEFDALRRALRRFVFPVSAAFLVWYALYVLLSAYARDFMSTKVVGHVNIALIFGLLQFVSTFLIAWRFADSGFPAHGPGSRRGLAPARAFRSGWGKNHGSGNQQGRP